MGRWGRGGGKWRPDDIRILYPIPDMCKQRDKILSINIFEKWLCVTSSVSNKVENKLLFTRLNSNCILSRLTLNIIKTWTIAWYSRYKLVVMATATIRCPGCGQEIMRGAAVECNFKPNVQATTFQQSFDRAQERHWLCMECKYIVENRYGDIPSVTSEDAYTLLYSVRVKKGSNCCNSCTII